MSAERICPNCGTALAADALEGICPRCAGRAALSISGGTEEGSDLREPALTPEIEAELARLKPEEAGEMIGPYMLMEQIGQGGFGTVWVADQEKPVRRRVALKIIKLGMDTKEVIARFEQERQALAITIWAKTTDPLRGHGQEVHAVAFANDGRLLASGSKDGVVLLWDAQAPRPESGRSHLPMHIQRAVGLPVGQTVLGRNADGKWSAIDLRTLGEEALPPSRNSGDGELPGLVPESRRHPTAVPDVSQLGLSGRLSKPALSLDRKLMAVSSEGGLVGLYNAETQSLIEILRGNLAAVFNVAFSPDNQRLALSSGGREAVEIWDVVTRQALITLSSPDMLLYDIEFTGDGDTLLVGTRDPRREGTGTCQFWRAPSWMDINDAERTGGLWPQTEAFRPPRPAPTVPELKKLLEQEYRKKLAVSREQSSENPVIRDESLANLADLLQQQGDHVEAESLFRELLESVRQRKPRNNVAVLAKTKNLLGVILSQDSGAPAKTSGRSQEADALVGEVLALLAQSSVADPQDTLLSLNVAALQVWFGKDAEHLATCQRLIEQAEKIPDDPSAEERAAKAWCLKPSSDSAILARTLRAARHAAEQELAKTERGWYQQSLGMAEYRAGNDVAAEQAMTRAMDYIKQSPNWSPKLHPYVEGPARLYRAMTLFRRGEETEARQLFVEAEAQMKPLPKDPREVLLTGAKQDDLLFWLAYKEAKALMQPEAQPAPAR